jgi:hypothetical protein
VRRSAPADSRVQVQLAASESLALLDQPVQQCPGVTLTSPLWPSREVIDVEVVAPSEVVADAKAGHRHGLFVVRDEGADQPLTRRAQNAIDMLGELPLILIRRSQRAHRMVRELGLPRGQLRGSGPVRRSRRIGALAPVLTLRGISSPIAVARWKTGSEMTLTDEPTVSPGMRAELQEMREVEAELTAFAARQLAVIEEDTTDPDQDHLASP